MPKAKRNSKPSPRSQSAKRELTPESAATLKFKAIVRPKDLSFSHSEWVKYASDVAPVIELALSLHAMNDKELTHGCTEETQAFMELCQAVQASLGRYRDLVGILEGAQARLLIALSRATEPVQPKASA